MTAITFNNGHEVKDFSQVGSSVQRGSIIVSGDATGRSLQYVYCDGGALLVSNDIVGLLDKVTERGLPLTISGHSVLALLTQGLVPLPNCIFAEIFVLGIGDRLECILERESWTVRHDVIFPYYSVRSRGDMLANPDVLMDLLVAAVGSAVRDARSPVLMLSAGKDSTALAVALARIGRHDVRALTFAANTEKDEDEYARLLCRRLGLEHQRVEIPSGGRISDETLTDFFRHAPFPCADDCQIPYVIALAEARAADVVLDGSGNDVYMGHVPSRNDRVRSHIRVRHSVIAASMRRIVPFGTRLDQLLRSSMDLCFLQGLLRSIEVLQLAPYLASAYDSSEALDQQAAGLDVFDYRALIRGRHYDQGSCALKAQVACEAAGMRCVLPWCDADIIDYYFNLPELARFDRRTFTNKILLREMLGREIDYPDAELGKRYFQFDRVGFFLANKVRVYEEILGCSHWDRGASEALLHTIYRRLPRNPRVGVALNAWFLLSGWLNHNRWLHAGQREERAT